MNDETDYAMPADYIAEQLHSLANPEPEGPPIRLRGPRDPVPTRAR